MPEFRKVDHAVASPTSCVGCGTHAGPFIDLGVAVPVYGQLYLCVESETRSGCAGQIARLNGGLDSKAALKLVEENEELALALATAQAELRKALESKFLKVEDLVSFGKAQTESTSGSGPVTITLGE